MALPLLQNPLLPWEWRLSHILPLSCQAALNRAISDSPVSGFEASEPPPDLNCSLNDNTPKKHMKIIIFIWLINESENVNWMSYMNWWCLLSPSLPWSSTNLADFIIHLFCWALGPWLEGPLMEVSSMLVWHRDTQSWWSLSRPQPRCSLSFVLPSSPKQGQVSKYDNYHYHLTNIWVWKCNRWNWIFPWWFDLWSSKVHNTHEGNEWVIWINDVSLCHSQGLQTGCECTDVQSTGVLWPSVTLLWYECSSDDSGCYGCWYTPLGLMSQIINHTISEKVREVLTLRIIFFITLEPVKDFQANLPETRDNRVNWNCDVDLESIGVKRLESVETLVGAVCPPVPPHPCRPGELGNYPRHSLWFFWSKSDFILSFE